MLTRQSCGFYRVRRGARAVAAHELKHNREMFPEDARVDMGEARHPRLSVATKGNRAPDVAHRPQREREVQHRRHAGILSEAKGEIVVTPGLNNATARSRWPRASRCSPANQAVLALGLRI